MPTLARDPSGRQTVQRNEHDQLYNANLELATRSLAPVPDLFSDSRTTCQQVGGVCEGREVAQAVELTEQRGQAAAACHVQHVPATAPHSPSSLRGLTPHPPTAPHSPSSL